MKLKHYLSELEVYQQLSLFLGIVLVASVVYSSIISYDLFATSEQEVYQSPPAVFNLPMLSELGLTEKKELPMFVLGESHINKLYNEGLNTVAGTEISGEFISIPKIKVRLPLREGTTEKQLSRGVGIVDGSPSFDKIGNVGLAGHRNHISVNKFFRRLDELTKGDNIYISTSKGVLRYKVYETLIVKPSAVEVLSQDIAKKRKKPVITLITCHPLHSNKERLIVHAERVD